MSKKKSLQKSIVKIQKFRFSQDMSADKLKQLRQSLKRKINESRLESNMGDNLNIPLPSTVHYDLNHKHKFKLSLPDDKKPEIYDYDDPIERSLN